MPKHVKKYVHLKIRRRKNSNLLLLLCCYCLLSFSPRCWYSWKSWCPSALPPPAAVPAQPPPATPPLSPAFSSSQGSRGASSPSPTFIMLLSTLWYTFDFLNKIFLVAFYDLNWFFSWFAKLPMSSPDSSGRSPRMSCPASRS